MSLFLLLAAFVLTGLNSISNVALKHLGLSGHIGLYSVGFWGTGVVLGLATLAITRHEVRKQDAAVGITMGLAGAIAMVLLLVALSLHRNPVPGVVAFPVRSCGNTTLTAVVSFLAWKERVTPRQWVGMALGLVVIYLLV